MSYKNLLSVIDRCKFNVIMYGLSESTSTDLPTKINDDKTSLTNHLLDVSQLIFCTAILNMAKSYFIYDY